MLNAPTRHPQQTIHIQTHTTSRLNSHLFAFFLGDFPDFHCPGSQSSLARASLARLALRSPTAQRSLPARKPPGRSPPRAWRVPRGDEMIGKPLVGLARYHLDLFPLTHLSRMDLSMGSHFGLHAWRHVSWDLVRFMVRRSCREVVPGRWVVFLLVAQRLFLGRKGQQLCTSARVCMRD